MSIDPQGPSGHFHAVRFYKDAGSLAEIVCSFLIEGLQQGDPAVVIATPTHLQTFRACFSAKGVDVATAIATHRLTLLDAEDTLSMFMRDGVPMAQPFTETMGPILRTVGARHPHASIRAYGEMVDVLWRKGQTTAAMRLEALWNDLARSHTFKLLCGYAMGSFYKGSSADDICGWHSHVVTDAGAHVPLS